MHVTHAIPVYAPAWQFGGPILSVSRLCEGLASEGIRVRVITTNAGLPDWPAAELGKPVLVAHGDTGRFCVDREFGGRRAPNLWRLNNGGDYVMDAAIVMAGDNATPFSFFRLRTGEPLETIC